MKTGEDLHRAYFEAMAGQGVESDPWFTLDPFDINAWEAVAALTTKEQRS